MKRVALYVSLVVLAAVTWPISAYIGGALFLVAAGMTIRDEVGVLINAARQ